MLVIPCITESAGLKIDQHLSNLRAAHGQKYTVSHCWLTAWYIFHCSRDIAQL